MLCEEPRDAAVRAAPFAIADVAMISPSPDVQPRELHTEAAEARHVMPSVGVPDLGPGDDPVMVYFPGSTLYQSPVVPGCDRATPPQREVTGPWKD